MCNCQRFVTNEIDNTIPYDIASKMEKRGEWIKMWKTELFLEYIKETPTSLLNESFVWPTPISLQRWSLCTRDEFELEFCSLSKPELWKFRAELGHINFWAETELTILTICMSKSINFVPLSPLGNVHKWCPTIFNHFWPPLPP